MVLCCQIYKHLEVTTDEYRMFSNATWVTQEMEYAHFSHVMFEHEDVRISLFQEYKYRD